MSKDYLKQLALLKQMEEKKAARTGDVMGVLRANSHLNSLADLHQAQQAGRANESTWFQKGAFEDGYQFGDVTKTILGTTNDISENVTTAVLDATENLIDTTAFGVGAIGGLFDKGFQDKVGKFIAKEPLTYNDSGAKLNNILNWTNPGGALTNLVTGGKTEENSVLGDKSDGLVQSGAHLVGSKALSLLGVPSELTMGVNAFGSEIENAYKNGASHMEAWISASVATGAEIIFEKLSGGVKFSGSTAGEAATKALSRNISNRITRSVLKWLGGTIGEGTEEVLTDAVTSVARKLTYEDEKTWNEVYTFEDAMDSFVGGVIIGGIADGGNAINSATKGIDHASGLTKAEEAVVRNEYDKRVAEKTANGEKLGMLDKNKIWDSVIKDMENGVLSTDAIEAVLGGESYQNYKNMVDGENALAEQEAALTDELNAISGKSWREMTGEEWDRMEELQTQLPKIREQIEANKTNSTRDALKEQVRNEVRQKVQGSKLAESYLEQDRARQALQADTSQYKSAAAKQTVKNAIEGGMNNQRRSHLFLDRLAKISEDTGIVFQFTNSQKLKDMGYSVDGAIINGFASKDGITLNLNSKKAINTVVGHELTHFLEGTPEYDALVKALKDYVNLKSEGTWDSMLAEITERYKNVEADPEKELVADLVGDLVFTDQKFVDHLSKKEPGAFKKLFERIKYLTKTFAGTEQGNQLEKVKQAFTEAWKAQKNTAMEDGMKYSLNSNAKSELHKALYDLKYRSEVLLRDESPAIMVAQKGVKNLPMAMKASHIRENVFTEEEARNLGLPVSDDINYHGLGEEFFLQIVDGLDNVKEAYRGTKNADNSSRRENYFLLVSEFTDKDGNTINVPVYIDEHAQCNRVFIDVNKISTVFGKRNFRAYIDWQIRKKNLVRIKNRSSQTSERSAPIAEGYGKDAPTDSIHSNGENVNEKFSLSVKDTELAPVDGWRVYGKDLVTDGDIAPVREDLAPVETATEEPKDIAPYEDNWLDAFESLTDEDAPPVQNKTPAKEISTVAERIKQKIKNAQAALEKTRQNRDQAMKDYDGEIAKVQAELDAKKNTNSKVANNLRARIERLNRLKADINADYGKRISDLESRVEKLHSKEYSRAEHRRAKMEQRTKFWENLVGDTSGWKDMALGLSYKTKTLRRILRSVVRDANGNPDIRRADAIYEALETKYDHNEALLKKESHKLKEVFQKLHLNHTEDAYAHMLGELRHNPDTTLTEDVVKEYYNKHKSKIDTKKVDTAITEARKTFDELIVRVNKVLRENGFKEISYRQGYFPHFQNPKQNWIQKALKWKPVNNEIPTSIAGLTEQFKPQRSWQSFDKQRKSDTTDYSLYQGLDTYIHGALDWIYHIDDLQSRRALENHLRFTHSDEGVKQRIQEIYADETLDADEVQDRINSVYKEANNPLGGLVRELMNRTNTLANKKAAGDRKAEDDFNRKVYSTMTNLNSRINANMVVGSLSSALTNFIPIVQSWHQVSPVYTVKALGDYVRSVVRDDGMIERSDFLTNRLMDEEKLYRTGWDRVSNGVAFMGNVVDGIASNTVWRSKYLQNLNEGMSESQAIKDADQFAKNVIAGRSRGNAPTIFDEKNPLTKIFTAFQLEVANQYGYMFNDVVKDSTSKARLVKGYATAFIGAYVYNMLYSSLVGRDAAFDPIGILEELFGDLFDEEEEPEEALLNLGENIIDEIPFISGLTGGGRVPLSSALPYGGDSTPFRNMLTDVTEGNWGSFGKELLKPLYYLAMPMGGGQLKKTVEGLSMFSDDHPIAGSYTDSGNLRFPVEENFGSKLQAALFGQWASENAREYFDEGHSPLTEKQTQELIDADMSIQEYWDYREGLKEQKTLEDKFDYIDSLDLSTRQKNILVNNIVDRKEDVDMTNYDDFGSYEEFDFAIKNPGKYAVAQAVGGYKAYAQYANDLKAIKADKDENGETISGSRKEKVLDYINSLDLEYGMKLILYKSQYKADDTYNRNIIKYLDGTEDISYEDTVAILTELGFTVSEDGRVTW